MPINLQNNLKEFCLISQFAFINHSSMIMDIININTVMKKVHSSTTKKTQEEHSKEQQFNKINVSMATTAF